MYSSVIPHRCTLASLLPIASVSVKKYWELHPWHHHQFQGPIFVWPLSETPACRGATGDKISATFFIISSSVIKISPMMPLAPWLKAKYQVTDGLLLHFMTRGKHHFLTSWVMSFMYQIIYNMYCGDHRIFPGCLEGLTPEDFLDHVPKANLATLKWA